MEILVREKLLKHYQQDVIVSHRGSLNIVTITAARRKIKHADLPLYLSGIPARSKRQNKDYSVVCY